MSFDNQGYQYNVKYESLLNRWGTSQEKRDLLGLTYAEKGYVVGGKPDNHLPAIRRDLTRFVAQLPGLADKQSLLDRIAAIQSSADVFALVDQLDSATATGAGSGSGSE